MFEVIIGIVFLSFLITTLVSVFKGAPYVTTTDKLAKKIIKLLKLKKGNNFVDLGSGNGKVVFESAKEGVYSEGFEINPFLVLFCKLKSKCKNVGNVKFILKSFWGVNLSKYDAIYVFGISYIMGDLEKKILKECKKGTKIVCQSYKLPNLKHIKEVDGLFLYILK